MPQQDPNEFEQLQNRILDAIDAGAAMAPIPDMALAGFVVHANRPPRNRNRNVFAWSGLGLGNLEAMQKPKVLSESQKKARDVVLNKETTRILTEMDGRARRRITALHVKGQKEQEYRDMLRGKEDAGRSVRELLDSDEPIYYMSLRNEHMHDIVSIGVNGLKKGDNGGYSFMCTRCYHPTLAEFVFLSGTSAFCASCVPQGEHCSRCRRQSKDNVPVPQLDGTNCILCQNCADESFCRQCDSKLPSTHVKEGWCAACLEKPSNDAGARTFSRSRAWIGKTPGSVMQSMRVFSCELEMGVGSSAAQSAILRGLPRDAGVAHDGSIKRFSYPFEVQTPKLAGAKGEEFIQAITSIVQANNAGVNDSCGMHIHLDGAGMLPVSRYEYPQALLQLWKTYLVFEDALLSFLPFSRRRNDFCRPIGEAFKFLELDTLTSLLEAEKLWYKERGYRGIINAKSHHRHMSRYFGVNLHSLLADGHLEIRYHSATLRAQRILEWANLHALIMDTAQVGTRFTNDFLYEAQHTSSLKEKTVMLFEAIGLVQSSREYFHARQQKFMDKKQFEPTNNND